MINKLKRKKQLVALLLFLLTVVFSYGQDTLIRKKYLDSVKNQLAIYTVTSYTHLNMYDQEHNDKIKIEVELDRTKSTLNYVIWRRRRENMQIGLGVFGMMILSFIMVIKFSK